MINFDGLINLNREGQLFPLQHELSAVRTKNNRFKQREGIGTYEKVFYPENSAISCWINNERDSFSTHWHPSIEIIMPLENIYSTKINDKLYMLEEGDILIIPPGELHELSYVADGFRLILLFNAAEISNLKGSAAIWSLFSVPTHISEKNSPDTYSEIKRLLLSILLEYINDESHWELSICMMFTQLFILLDRKKLISSSLLTSCDLNKQQEYIVKFNTVFEYIDKNYAEDIDLDDVAEVAGFSKFHFTRLFKMFTNTSFNNYLNARRIRAAETLLLDPELPITDIALMSGFTSISNFNRVFKTFKNCTPSEFKGFLNHDMRGLHDKIIC